MDKVRLQENEELYLEIDDYYGFEYLAPHLMELDASLNELNDLAGRLAAVSYTHLRKETSIFPVRCPPAKMDTLARTLLASV